MRASYAAAVAFAAIFTSLGCHSTTPTMKMPLELYYVPIGIETSTPVMSEETEQKGGFARSDPTRRSKN